MAGGYIGFNKEGVKPITAAINAYISAIKDVNFKVTDDIVKGFAKGNKSIQGIRQLFTIADNKMDNIVKTSLDPLKKRINGLESKYKSSDSTLKSTIVQDANKRKALKS